MRSGIGFVRAGVGWAEVNGNCMYRGCRMRLCTGDYLKKGGSFVLVV